jgi:hypothetical protein
LTPEQILPSALAELLRNDVVIMHALAANHETPPAPKTDLRARAELTIKLLDEVNKYLQPPVRSSGRGIAR